MYVTFRIYILWKITEHKWGGWRGCLLGGLLNTLGWPLVEGSGIPITVVCDQCGFIHSLVVSFIGRVWDQQWNLNHQTDENNSKIMTLAKSRTVLRRGAHHFLQRDSFFWSLKFLDLIFTGCLHWHLVFWECPQHLLWAEGRSTVYCVLLINFLYRETGSAKHKESNSSRWFESVR